MVLSTSRQTGRSVLRARLARRSMIHPCLECASIACQASSARMARSVPTASQARSRTVAKPAAKIALRISTSTLICRCVNDATLAFSSMTAPRTRRPTVYAARAGALAALELVRPVQRDRNRTKSVQRVAPAGPEPTAPPVLCASIAASTLSRSDFTAPIAPPAVSACQARPRRKHGTRALLAQTATPEDLECATCAPMVQSPTRIASTVRNVASEQQVAADHATIVLLDQSHWTTEPNAGHASASRPQTQLMRTTVRCSAEALPGVRQAMRASRRNTVGTTTRLLGASAHPAKLGSSPTKAAQSAWTALRGGSALATSALRVLQAPNRLQTSGSARHASAEARSTARTGPFVVTVNRAPSHSRTRPHASIALESPSR